MKRPRPASLPVPAGIEARPGETGPGRRRLGEVLVAEHVITEAQLEECLAAQRAVRDGQPRPRLGAVLLERGYANDDDIARALAHALGLATVDLSVIPIVPETARLVPRELAEREGVLVLGYEGDTVTVAVSDPTDVVALDDVRYHTGAAHLRLVVATDQQVREQLRRAWSLLEGNDVATLLDSEDSDALWVNEAEADKAAQTAPIVRLVDVILNDAMVARASDIHLEPGVNSLRVRFRVDGVLRDAITVPRSAAPAVASRVKIISGLDIAERRRPQDGRARLTINGDTIDTRVSTLPSLHGEKIVIRLLARADAVPALDDTGLDGPALIAVSQALEAPQGLVLITGPTGSGKTNTLYAAIQQIATNERNIITLEDPVEVQFPGITQVQIHEKAGMTFAAGLRSVLRQDPDVVLVGEVRDTETAELALQASLTGHLVLTTLHTNDTIRAITRLVDMGVEPFLIASSLTLVLAQRLVRKPCPQCVEPTVPDERVLRLLGLSPSELGDATPMAGTGCIACGNSGYHGRIGVFEVLPITATIRQVMLEDPSESALAAAVQAEGGSTLRMAALAAARKGITTYDEVLRATHVDAVDPGRGTHCHSCTRMISTDMLFCPWCRAPIPRHECSQCGRRLDAKWSGCPWCGAEPAPVVATKTSALPGPSQRRRPNRQAGRAATKPVVAQAKSPVSADGQGAGPADPDGGTPEPPLAASSDR